MTMKEKILKQKMVEALLNVRSILPRSTDPIGLPMLDYRRFDEVAAMVDSALRMWEEETNMDPDTALTNARRLVRRVVEGRHDGNSECFENDAIQLAEAFDALDQWLSKGGFLPKGWNREVTSLT